MAPANHKGFSFPGSGSAGRRRAVPAAPSQGHARPVFSLGLSPEEEQLKDLQASDRFEAAGWHVLGFLQQQQMHTLEALLEQSVLETVKSFLRQSGFVHLIQGEETYDFHSLSQLSAQALQTLVSKLPLSADLLHFALRIRGATLSDPLQRQTYIRESLLATEARAAGHLFEMSDYLQGDPEHPTVLQALNESIRLASASQLLAFLQACGFIRSQPNPRESGHLIHEEALRHLPAEPVQLLLTGLGDNPDPLSWGHYFPSHAEVVRPLRRLLT